VTDLHTERLTLRPVGTDEAERIVARQPGPQDSWAEDFPFDGDVIGATMFLRGSYAPPPRAVTNSPSGTT
jgi:hypothetical protein